MRSATEEPLVRSAPERSHRGRTIVAGLAISALAVAGGAVLLQDQGPGTGIMALPAAAPTASPTPSGPSQASARPNATVAPTASPSATDPDELDQKSAESVVKNYVAAIQREVAVKANKNARGKFALVAAGADLEQLANQHSELESNGWVQKGSVKVEDLTIVENQRKAKPPTVIVQACFDSTGVTTYDSDGVAIPSGSKASQRSLNTVTFQRIKGRWLVVDRSFPKDPSC